jgi:effector-binding domain-containing protein
MKYRFSIRETRPQPTMCIRGRTTRSALALTLGEFLAHVRGYIERCGAQPAGPPYTRYHSIQGEDIDVEAGFPVTALLAPEGRIRAGELPGGEVASTVHHGDYDGLNAAAEALAVWVRNQDREASGPTWQIYVTHRGAEANSAKWVTQVFEPLKKKVPAPASKT